MVIGFLKQRGFTIGYVWAIVGTLLLLTGVGIDLLHHASSPHAEAERIFDGGNPGHIVAIFGLYNLVAGLLLAGFSRWVLGRWSPRWSLALAGGLAVLVAAASVSVVRLDSRLDGHAATEAAGGHRAEGHALPLLPESSLFAQIEELTFREPANSTPVTRQNLEFAESFIAKARQGTGKYKDVNVALNDGYIQITPYIPIIGAHFAHPGAANALDPARPPILLYRPGKDGGWELVGAAYTQRKRAGVERPPATPFGGLIQWHYHTNLCFQVESLSITFAPRAAQCSGTFVAETPWLLHAWLWLDSPEGIFDHANSLLQ